MSRYGKIEITKENSWSESVNGYSITPYMQDMLLYAGQNDNYSAAQRDILKFLGVKADDSQIKNLVTTYGKGLEENLAKMEEEIDGRGASLAKKIGSNEYAYGMMDGGMVLTREEAGKWKEMKLGRVFTDTDLFKINDKRGWVRDSLYTAHFGDSETFMSKFEPILDHFEPLNERLVFINDGASWIWKSITELYPKATQILDFFHACEYLTDFSKAFFKNEADRKIWISTQKIALKADEIAQIIENIETMEGKTKVQIAAQEKILTYYKNNEHRMLYQTYRDKNMLIGSGPIESAHRVVIQKRMKQSGQRWTINGGQQVANLRVAHLNNQWDRVVNLIKKPMRA